MWTCEQRVCRCGWCSVIPFYTYKCNTCGLEKDFLKSMNDSKSQLCPKCMYDPYVQGDDEKMTRVFKPNAKPGSKDGSWGFSK